MNAIYHLSSAEDVDIDMINAIKTTFKSKPITIFVEEDVESGLLSENMKAVLDDRLLQSTDGYLTSTESIDRLNKKYGL